VKPGHCTACGTPCWRGFVHPATQAWTHLWPDPTSVYAVLETAEGLAVGLAYHAACAPALGADGPVSVMANARPLGPSTVVRLDRAPERYTYWFSPRFGGWLSAWTRELAAEYRVPIETFEALVAQWEQDRTSSLEMAVTNG
jgi:hypothetical protein